MNLQGFYTNKGRALAAKIAAGTTALTVTRVVASSGHTEDIPSATALPDIEQTLTVGTAVVEGTTATLPVTLAEAQAEGSYSLTELGVYAADPQEGEILMQVYQLDVAQSITAHGEGVLRFYLRQSIGAQGVSVTCSPAGILVDEDLAPTRGRVMATTVPSHTVTVAANELQNYINSLPRLLTEDLTINVTSGTVTEVLEINRFYGSGSLTIQAADGAAVDCTHGIFVCYCSALITLIGFSLHGNTGYIDHFFYILGSPNVIVSQCSVDGTGTTGNVGIRADNRSMVYFISCNVQNCYIGIQISAVSLSTLYDCSGSGNTIGIHTYRGGIVTLSGTTPNLMGGSTNEKGGPIFRNGQLI